MIEIILYGIGFFLLTLLLQYVLYKCRKNHNHGKSSVWTGTGAVLVICLAGLFTQNINYLAAVIGFVFADEIGHVLGWH